MKLRTKWMLGGLGLIVLAVVLAALLNDDEHHNVDTSAKKAGFVPAPLHAANREHAAQLRVPAPAAPQIALQPPPETRIRQQPLPEPIVKAVAEMHRAALNRPMDTVAKDWFACVSSEQYDDTLSLLTQSNPASAAQFGGEKAPCIQLHKGVDVKLLHVNDSNGMALISLDRGKTTLWTDSGALAGADQVR